MASNRPARRATWAAALVLAAVAAGLAAGAPAAAAPTPTACPPGIAAALAPRVDCGLIPVPLRHEAAGGPQIAVAYARIRAARPVRPDPLIVLGGGPGEHLVRAIPSFGPSSPLLGLAARRDLVLIDQRGAGRSRPALECTPELARLRPTAGTGDLSRALVRCAGRLKAAGTDLGAFTTLQNAADLDTVRRELGYASVNLFGTSYGARLAQQALRGDPPWIRSVTLASPIPAEANFVQDAPRSYAQALARTFALCAASPSCRGAYPALGRSLDRGLRRLQARPARVRVPDPATGRRATVTVTAGTVSALLFSLYYAPDGPSAVPSVVSAIGEGDERVIAELLAGSPVAGAPLSVGMQRAFLCQEEVARTTPAAFARGLRGLPRAARLLAGASPVIGRPAFATCAGWALAPADPATFAPVASSIPALVVTGQLDQITPPRYGVRVARQLSRSVLVRVPGVGHSPLLAAGPCGVRILRAFVDRPDRRPPTACLRLAS